MADYGLPLSYLGKAPEALAMFEHIPVKTFRVAAYMAACCARLGEAAAARRHAAECVALNPAFSIRQQMSKEPFSNEPDTAELAESLRLAGLPE